MIKTHGKSNFSLMLVAAGIMLALAPGQSRAVYYNLEPTQLLVLGEIKSMNAELVTANTSLGTIATNTTTLNTYLETGNNGNGLIPLLSSINDKLGKSNANESETELTQNSAARARIYDESMLGLKAGATPTQETFQRACVAVTSRMTTPQGHGAAGGASDVFRNARSFAPENEQAMTAEATESTRLADLVAARGKKGFCDAQAIKNDSPGCVGQSPGAMPNADVRSSSLTMGATAVPEEPTNGSLDQAQLDAGHAYIRQSQPQPAAIPDDAARQTAEGKTYMAYLNKYVARQAASRDAMSSILDSHAQIPSTINGKAEMSPSLQDWRAKKVAWEQTFGPQIKFPETPSERDTMRFEVFNHYSNAEYISSIARIPVGRPDIVGGIAQVGKEQLALQALNTRILFQMLERQEQANILLAQILNQSMDPMTRKEMTASVAKMASKQ
jgi:hypothetical protein